jgi:hypothetical protein
VTGLTIVDSCFFLGCELTTFSDQVQKKRENKKGYVAIPRCPVIFDGANYPDFAAFMHVHMRSLRLWGVLSGEVSYPPCPTPPVAPIPPTLVILGDGASQEAKDAAKSADDSLVVAYELKLK